MEGGVGKANIAQVLGIPIDMKGGKERRVP